MVKKIEKQEIGRIGEGIAAKYLESKGFTIIQRNYRKKCGEIDIITQRGKILHFIEVKTVSCENFNEIVSRETDNYRPEDNVHAYKLKRLARTIQLYILEKSSKGEPEWVFDVITVKLDTKNKQARVRVLDNIVL